MGTEELSNMTEANLHESVWPHFDEIGFDGLIADHIRIRPIPKVKIYVHRNWSGPPYVETGRPWR